MHSLRFTVILFVILFVPFVLRVKAHLEPYPAILMPSGASLTKVSPGRKIIRETLLYGRKEDGRWEVVDAEQFLSPIPVQFLPPILGFEFGFKDKKVPSRLNRYLPSSLKSHYAKNKDDTQKEEVKRWIKLRLKEQNFIGDTLRIVQNQKTIAGPNGQAVNNVLLHEKLLPLD